MINLSNEHNDDMPSFSVEMTISHPSVLALLSMAADLVTYINNDETRVSKFIEYLENIDPYFREMPVESRHEIVHGNIYRVAYFLNKLRDDNSDVMTEYMIQQTADKLIESLEGDING